jgi:hypothetical protein
MGFLQRPLFMLNSHSKHVVSVRLQESTTSNKSSCRIMARSPSTVKAVRVPTVSPVSVA